MGCGSSTEYDTIYASHPKVKELQEDFEKIGLTEKEIGRFYKQFQENKIDAFNNCRVKEVVYHMHLNGEKFMKRYWESVAKGEDKRYLTFAEYVFGFWNFLSLRQLQKTYDRFTFELYADKNGRNKGTLSSQAAITMLDELYGPKKDFICKKAIRALQDPKSADRFTLSQWSAFTAEQEGIFSPLQDYQKKERFKLMGIKFWERKTDARKRFTKGKSYSNLDETLLENGILHVRPSSTLLKKPAPQLRRGSSSRQGILGPKTHSQGTLIQGNSSNSLHVDG